MIIENTESIIYCIYDALVFMYRKWIFLESLSLYYQRTALFMASSEINCNIYAHQNFIRTSKSSLKFIKKYFHFVENSYYICVDSKCSGKTHQYLCLRADWVPITIKDLITFWKSIQCRILPECLLAMK